MRTIYLHLPLFAGRIPVLTSWWDSLMPAATEAYYPLLL